MNHYKTFSFLAAVLACAALAGCGGSGSPDDGQTPLRASPAEITLTSESSTCPPAAGLTVFVLGGVAPYSLRNPVPDRVLLDKESVANTGEGVKITFTGGCLTTIPLTIIDRIGNTTTVTMSYTGNP